MFGPTSLTTSVNKQTPTTLHILGLMQYNLLNGFFFCVPHDNEFCHCANTIFLVNRVKSAAFTAQSKWIIVLWRLCVRNLGRINISATGVNVNCSNSMAWERYKWKCCKRIRIESIYSAIHKVFGEVLAILGRSVLLFYLYVNFL